jgi:phosphoserine phosphatase
MERILSLIAPPGALCAAQLACLAGLPGLGAPHWLAPDEACEMTVAPGDAGVALQRAASERLADQTVDVNLVPVAGRRKRLLVADMESTLIRNEMLDELAELIGAGPAVAAITARAMNGEIDFHGALRDRVALLAGQPAGLLDEAAQRIAPMPGAATLIATMRRHGATTAIVSGGFRVFTARVRAALGADHDIANSLDLTADGARLAGTIRAPILDGQAKVATLARLAAAAGVTPAEALATGDGANDLPMLALAGLGVAFRAKPRVAASARWRIVHGDLTALLYLQGYRRDEFVVAP